jgi:predicted transcriptional regulator
VPESTVVVRVDDRLKAEFMDAAKAADRTTSQLLRDFMRDFVKEQAARAEYDEWFREKVAEGIADARAGRVNSSEKVETYFSRKRAATRRTLGKRSDEA